MQKRMYEAAYGGMCKWVSPEERMSVQYDQDGWNVAQAINMNRSTLDGVRDDAHEAGFEVGDGSDWRIRG